MNENILNTLIKLAKETPPSVRNFRICAAVVFKHREAVSLGFPRKKSHPVQKEFGRNEFSVYLHAEVDAIIRARKLVKIGNEHSLYVVRVKHPSAQSEEFIVGNAKPCTGCTRFIHRCGIGTTHYTIG